MTDSAPSAATGEPDGPDPDSTGESVSPDATPGAVRSRATAASPPKRDESRSAASSRPVFGALAALGFAALVGYLALRPAPTSAARSTTHAPARVETTRARRVDHYDELRAHTGRVEAARTARVGSEIGGTLLRVLVDEGDTVAADAPLAEFDTTRLEARRGELLAERKRQEAVLAELRAGARKEDIAAQRAETARLDAAAALADLTAARTEKAYEENAVAVQDWDQARLAAEQARAAADAATARLAELTNGVRPERVDAQVAAVAALNASIESVDVDIRKASIRAPFAARVARRLADEGMVLGSGAPVLELREVPSRAADGTARGGLEIRVGVLPSFAAGLAVGEDVPIRWRGGAAGATARVRAVRADRSPSTRTVPVLLETTPAAAAVDRPLGDGDLVDVLFRRRIEIDALDLPLAALSEGPRGLWRCLVAQPLDASDAAPSHGDGSPSERTEERSSATHRLTERTVEIVHFDERRAFVRGTLGADDLVVRSGLHRLAPGMLVNAEEPR